MNATITANRGEWSELYVLLKLLAEGKLFGSDDTLELKTDIVYSVLEVVTNYDTPKHINYQLKDDEIIIYNSVQKTSYQIKKKRSQKTCSHSLQRYSERKRAFVFYSKFPYNFRYFKKRENQSNFQSKK